MKHSAKYSAYILSAAFISLSTGTAAIACEFHGGGGGPFQSRWQNYTSEQTPMEETSFDDDQSYQTPAAPTVKKKPVFSKAASRASTIAKARVERTAKLEKAEAEKAEAAVTEQASR